MSKTFSLFKSSCSLIFVFLELQNIFCTQHACGFRSVSYHPGLHLHCQNTEQLQTDQKTHKPPNFYITLMMVFSQHIRSTVEMYNNVNCVYFQSLERIHQNNQWDFKYLLIWFIIDLPIIKLPFTSVINVVEIHKNLTKYVKLFLRGKYRLPVGTDFFFLLQKL